MLMRRSDFAANIAMGIADATAGLCLYAQALDAHPIWPLSILAAGCVTAFGFALIIDAARTLEVDEFSIAYQNVFSVKRIEWTDIDAYILDNDRFIAIDTFRHRILLDITLRGDDKRDWPVEECARIRQFIQRKMNEIGAQPQSFTSLRNTHGIKFKP